MPVESEQPKETPTQSRAAQADAPWAGLFRG